MDDCRDIPIDYFPHREFIFTWINWTHTKKTDRERDREKKSRYLEWDRKKAPLTFRYVQIIY